MDTVLRAPGCLVLEVLTGIQLAMWFSFCWTLHCVNMMSLILQNLEHFRQWV